MTDKWDEITQMDEAYKCLRTQPRDAQIRMLEWLSARLADDHDKAMQAREAAAKARIADRASAGG